MGVAGRPAVTTGGEPSRPGVVSLVGPTGAGKSALALEAAERARSAVEIVAVDAFTVYRGLDVATAKPDLAGRARVPHHLVDVLEPRQECTVQWFQRAARSAISEVRERGAVPLLVGGSGLYFRAVVDDLAFPPTDPDLRANLEERYRHDPRAAHRELTRVDPEAAARIDPPNLRRSVRALEVLHLTGRPFSAWRTAWEEHRSVYDRLVVLAIHLDRDALARRIRERARRMVASGLLAETRALATRPHGLSTTARQAIGTREALAALAGRADRDATVEAISVRTRRYAARQRRWFVADPRVRWGGTAETARALQEALASAAAPGPAARSAPPSSS